MTYHKGIKIRHLQCFVETARLKSVGKAAQLLAVSQPAISKSLRELETALNVKLLERDGRGIRLTRFGEVFLRHAGQSLGALKQGIDSVDQARSGGGSLLTVGALPTVSAGVLPRAIAGFKRDGLGATVRVVTGENSVLLSQLRLGELDIVVGRLADPDKMTGLTFEHLYSEAIGFFVRRGHPLAGMTPFRLEAIAGFPVLIPGPDAAIRNTVQRFLIAQGVGVLPDRIETVSLPFGRAFLRNSDAVWIISRGVVGEDLHEGWMIELPVDTATTAGPVGLTMRADTPPPLAAQFLMESIRRAAASR